MSTARSLKSFWWAVSKKSLCLIVLALPLLLCIGCAPSAAPVKDRYSHSPPLEDQVAALKGKLAQSKGADPTLLRELGLAAVTRRRRCFRKPAAKAYPTA